MLKVRAVVVMAGLAAAAGAGIVGAAVSGATPAPARLGVTPVPGAASPSPPQAAAPPTTARPVPDPTRGAGVVPVAPPPAAEVVVNRPIVDIDGCALTGVYELSSPIPTDIQALYVNPADAGGPAAALRGDTRIATATAPTIEVAATGATYSVWETPGAEPLVLGAKRMTEAEVGTVSNAVAGSTSALPTGLSLVAPTFSGAKVYGSACELDGEFYAVEVVEGSLADRTWWLLNTDPVASSDAGDVTTARYSSSGLTDFAVRQATEEEWASYQAELALPETAASAQGGLSG